MGPLDLLMAWITEVATRIATTAIMTRNAVDRENGEHHPVLMTMGGARNGDKRKTVPYSFIYHGPYFCVGTKFIISKSCPE